MPKARIGRSAAALWRLFRREEQNAASSTAVGRGRSRSTPRWLSPGLLAITLVTSLGLSACGSPSASPPSTTSTPSTSVSTSTSSPSNSSTAPVSAEASAVLDAYRAQWAAYEHAVATANPLDPALQATMVNPVLHQVIGNLVTDNAEGIVGTGSIQLNPKVASIDGSTATVLDCSLSSFFLVYKKTGKQVPPVSKTEHDAVKAMLVLDGSTWKTKSRQITEGSCPAGY